MLTSFTVQLACRVHISCAQIGKDGVPLVGHLASPQVRLITQILNRNIEQRRGKCVNDLLSVQARACPPITLN
jgi:hypothetical protein